MQTARSPRVVKFASKLTPNRGCWYKVCAYWIQSAYSTFGLYFLIEHLNSHATLYDFLARFLITFPMINISDGNNASNDGRNRTFDFNLSYWIVAWIWNRGQRIMQEFFQWIRIFLWLDTNNQWKIEDSNNSVDVFLNFYKHVRTIFYKIFFYSKNISFLKFSF